MSVPTGAEPLCETGRPAAMGHAGGDPVNACENTVEATLAGLRSRRREDIKEASLYDLLTS